MRLVFFFGVMVLSLVLLSGQSFASDDSSVPAASNICGTEDLASLQCDGDRDCALKTETLISDYVNDYVTPQVTSFPSFQYPDRCLFESAPHEVVNFVFDIKPNGNTKNRQMLNSSNACFNGMGRLAMRKVKFEKSTSGFRCGILSIEFDRPALPGDDERAY